MMDEDILMSEANEGTALEANIARTKVGLSRGRIPVKSQEVSRKKSS